MPLKQSMHDNSIHRATLREFDEVYSIVQEYYEAARVVARDSREELERFYFGDGSGFWLATHGSHTIGCIALRPLAGIASAGEVKRLYVQPAHRGRRLAQALYHALQTYASTFAYQWLYLDTVHDMSAAIQFYKSQGFAPCEKYNDNPQATIFLRKALLSELAPLPS